MDVWSFHWNYRERKHKPSFFFSPLHLKDLLQFTIYVKATVHRLLIKLSNKWLIKHEIEVEINWGFCFKLMKHTIGKVQRMTKFIKLLVVKYVKLAQYNKWIGWETNSRSSDFRAGQNQYFKTDGIKYFYHWRSLVTSSSYETTIWIK